MLHVMVIQMSLCCAGLCETAHHSDSPRWGDVERGATDWRASTFSASAQAEAAIDVDEHDELTVVWSSRRQQDGRSGVYLQRLCGAHSRLGEPGYRIGGEQRINVWANSHEIAPDVDSANGVTWIVWQSHGRDGDGAAIMARTFHRAASGELVGGDEILVNQEWNGDQSSPVVSAAHDGSAMIVWTSRGGDQGWNQLPQVHARVFDASGRGLTDEFRVSGRLEGSPILPPRVAAGLGDQSGVPGAERRAGAVLRGGASSPCVAFSGGEVASWAVAYAKLNDDHSLAGLALCHFDLCGQIVGNEVDLAEFTSHNAVEPVIAAGEHGMMLAWCSPRDAAGASGNYQVMALGLDVQGKATNVASAVHAPSPAHRNAPAIGAMPRSQGYVIAWNVADGDGTTSVVARQFDIGGNPISDERTITKHASGSQTLRAAAGTNRLECNLRGDLLCAWNGDGGFGDDSAVHVSLVAAETGSPLVEAARGVSVTPTDVGGHATRQVDFATEEDLEVQRAAAQPHEPPQFDKRMIDQGVREPARIGIDEIGFVGILSTGWTPPDPHLAVGPDHLVAITNGEIAFLTKTGTVLFQDEIEGLGGFWGSVGATTFVFDPEILFDDDAERFFAMASETISTQNRSFVLIAVSDDADPMGTWHKYRVETTALAGTTFDSPNISVDEFLVYVTGDRAGSINAYPVYVFSKLAMMAGNLAPIIQSVLMPTTAESAGIPPVNFDDTQALYFIEHGEAESNTTVRLIAMTNQITSPTFTSILMDVPAYGPPEDPPQMGTTVRPETFDARFWSVAYRNGSLWATHHINSDRVIVRWYEFKMNNWPMSGQTPELVQWGEIDPGGTVRTFFSAITVDGNNNAALVFARSSPSEFISMQTAHRYASDPPGTFQTPITRQTNVGPYTTSRWGDYAGINVDPVDGLTMWAHHEYSVNNSWRTWIQSFYPGNPCPPDINADGNVDVDDLLAVINAWGFCIDCEEDIAPPGGNLMVDVDDLLYVINSWGGCF